jgi:hypothetical protein
VCCVASALPALRVTQVRVLPIDQMGTPPKDPMRPSGKILTLSIFQHGSTAVAVRALGDTEHSLSHSPHVSMGTKVGRRPGAGTPTSCPGDVEVKTVAESTCKAARRAAWGKYLHCSSDATPSTESVGGAQVTWLRSLRRRGDGRSRCRKYVVPAAGTVTQMA